MVESYKKQLEKGCDITKISHWAYDVFFNHRRELNNEVEELLQYLFFMEEGPQFEYTEKELVLANLLIREEKGPIKQIKEMKSNKSPS